MKKVSKIIIASLFAFASVGAAFAQAPAPAPAVVAPAVKPAPRVIPLSPQDPAAAKPVAAKPATTKPVNAKAERSALSKKCSADADAKGLHGKERSKFRNECKKAKS